MYGLTRIFSTKVINFLVEFNTMYSSFHLALKYLTYYLTASNGKGHGTHSPFVYDFITKILNDKINHPAYKKVEGLRKQLLQDSRLFVVEDFGVGGKFLKKYEKSINSIAKDAAKSKKYGQLLFRMVNYYQPATIVELGTSLGITTSYLSLAKPNARLTTMEGAREIGLVAKQNFNKLQLTNIELIEGNFDETLAGVIRDLPSVDFAFVDGNHRQEPTEKYFQQLLSKINNDSILVFDDIHWSGEMEAAWRTIKVHEAVKCTIDLFFIGIVLFRREFKEKQHFVIRF